LVDEFLALLMAAKDAAAPDAPTAPPKPAPESSAAEPTSPESPPGAPAPEPVPPNRGGQSPDAAADDRKAPEPTAEQQRAKLLEAWSLTDQFEQLEAIAADPAQLDKVTRAFQALVAEVNRLLILPSQRHFIEVMDEERQHILIYSGDGAESKFERRETATILNATSTTDRDTFRETLLAAAGEHFADTGLGLALRRKIVQHFVDTLQPNLRFDSKLTNRKQDEAAQRVPEKVQQYRRTMLLVPRGEVITPALFAVLRVEHEAYLREIRWYARASAVVGSIILVGLLTVLAVGYTALFQPNVIDRAVRAFILVALALLVMLIAKFFHAQLQRSMVIFPVTTAAMIVTVAYNRRFALAFTWVLILLVTLVTRLEDYGVVLLLVVGTSVAILQLGEVRNRSKLVRVGFATGLVYFVIVWAQEMMGTGQPTWPGEFVWLNFQ
jgi:membrane-associated HD superfamily phosphohydrolase